MFIADYSCAGHGKDVSSMLPLNDITPVISSPWACWEFEEMIASEPFLIVIAACCLQRKTAQCLHLFFEDNRVLSLLKLLLLIIQRNIIETPKEKRKKAKESVLCSHK